MPEDPPPAPRGRALKAAGIEDFRCHDLRHTAATRTLRASGNSRAVQMMPGHSDITTTARYAHALVKDVRAAMEAASRHTIPTEPQVAVARSLEKRVIEVLNLVPKQVLQ